MSVAGGSYMVSKAKQNTFRPDGVALLGSGSGGTMQTKDSSGGNHENLNIRGSVNKAATSSPHA